MYEYYFYSSILEIVQFYIGGGLLWLIWIEWYTTKHKIGGNWSNRERLTQFTIWPIALCVFIYNLLKQL